MQPLHKMTDMKTKSVGALWRDDNPYPLNSDEKGQAMGEAHGTSEWGYNSEITLRHYDSSSLLNFA